MSEDAKAAVRQVLKEAGNQPHFFDLSDGERLNWMIAYAYELGLGRYRQFERPGSAARQRVKRLRRA